MYTVKLFQAVSTNYYLVTISTVNFLLQSVILIAIYCYSLVGSTFRPTELVLGSIQIKKK